MKVVCSWCKEHIATKEPVEDTRISHTICRDCSIKYFDKDPGERDTSDDVSNPVKAGSRKLMTKRGISGVWQEQSSESKRRLIVDANALMPVAYYDMHKYMSADWAALPKDLKARVKRLFWGARPKRKERVAKNPATSERQRKFMCAELGRKRAGKKTCTGMGERSLRDYCRKNSAVPMWKSRLIYEAERLAKSGAGYTQYEIIDYLKNQNKDISEKSIESAVKIALKRKGRKHRNPQASKASIWKRVAKEMAVYLRKAGYDKDAAYVSIYNRLGSVPDTVVRSAVNEAYRIGKNRRKARR